MGLDRSQRNAQVARDRLVAQALGQQREHFAFALRHMGAGRLGVTTYLVPPITIVMGLVFLGEAPPTLAYFGGILALVGVGVARRRPQEASR